MSSAPPPLSHESVLRTNAGTLRSRKSELSKPQRRLLNLANGKRTLAAVVAASRMPRKRAMEALEWLAREGFIEVARSSSSPKRSSVYPKTPIPDSPSAGGPSAGGPSAGGPSARKVLKSRVVGVVEPPERHSNPPLLLSKRRTLLRGSFVVPAPSTAPSATANAVSAGPSDLETVPGNPPFRPPGVPQGLGGQPYLEGRPGLAEQASNADGSPTIGRTLIGGLVSLPQDAKQSKSRASIVPHSVISLASRSQAVPADATPDSAPRQSGIIDSEAPVGDSAVQLGRYEVVRRIGRGGMGSVYLCRLQGEWGFSRLLALKVLRGHLAGASDAHEEFLREARLASQLTHPNVVPIMDVGRYESQPFIVMQYIEGVSLFELLSEKRAPQSDMVVAVVLDALAGLDYAHNLRSEDGDLINLVHCDVSPHNLLVGLDGSCRVADFGVAQARVAGLNDEGRPVSGKPGYASPEQLEGGDLDARSDVYSMGVTLWNALTGQSLFSNNLDENTIVERKSEIRAPSTIADSPEALDEVCLKALALDPADRFQTAEEMLRALRRTAVMHDLVASPRSVGEWVQNIAGAELEARRLECDAERQSFVPAPKAAASEDAEHNTASLRQSRNDSGEAGQGVARRTNTVATAAPDVGQLPPITKTQAWTFAALAIATLCFAGIMIFKPELVGSTMRVNPEAERRGKLAAQRQAAASAAVGHPMPGIAADTASPKTAPVVISPVAAQADDEGVPNETAATDEAEAPADTKAKNKARVVRATRRRTRVLRLRKTKPVAHAEELEPEPVDTEAMDTAGPPNAAPPATEIITVVPPKPLPGAPPPPPPAMGTPEQASDAPPVKRDIYE